MAFAEFQKYSIFASNMPFYAVKVVRDGRK